MPPDFALDIGIIARWTLAGRNGRCEMKSSGGGVMHGSGSVVTVASETDLIEPLALGEAQSPRRSTVIQRIGTWFAEPQTPLVIIFVGYPLWWILGLTQPVIMIACFIMGARLLRKRRLVAPPGFRLWLIFLFWVLLGGFVVQAEAPGVVVGANPNRYFTWALRLVWYLEATIVLLYVANAQRSLSAMRIARILSVMFVFITIGGVLGVMAPTANIRSLAELVLPSHLTSNAFVSSQIHPNLAERQVYIDQVRYRPSAPFRYANEWGLNFGCFLPIFVVGWCGRTAAWRRIFAPFVLLASLIPVIYSLNRGLWSILIVIVLIAVYKQVRGGNLRLLVALVTVAVLVTAVIAMSPLGSAIAGRFSGHNSNEGRTTLSVTSIEAVAQSSPIVGMGTTRDVQGTFYSIAGGSTPSCPTCSPPAFGTQGFLWLLIFGQGIVGGSIGLAFFLVAVWRHMRRRSPTAVAYVCSLLAFMLTLAIYDWSVTAAFAVMISISVLGRMAGDPNGHFGDPPDAGRLRRITPLADTRLALVCCMVGALLGAGWHLYWGPTYTATASVWLPAVPSRIGLELGDESTLDTQSRFILSPRVVNSVSGAGGPTSRSTRGHLSVTASPNTRILNLEYTSSDPNVAIARATAAARAMIDLRTSRLVGERRQLLQTAAVQSAALDRATTAIDKQLNVLHAMKASASGADAIEQLIQRRKELGADGRQLQTRRAEVANTSIDGGELLKPAHARRAPQRWNVSITSGIAVGMLSAIAVTAVRRRWGRKVDVLKRADLRRELGNTPVLLFDEIDPKGFEGRLLRPTSSTEILCIDQNSPRLYEIADALNQSVTRNQVPDPHSQPGSVILLASTTSHTSSITAAKVRLQASGIKVAGLGVWRDRRK